MSTLGLARTIRRALRADDPDTAIIAYFALRERVEPDKALMLLRRLMRRCGWR
jgi:hypothetical protein